MTLYTHTITLYNRRLLPPSGPYGSKAKYDRTVIKGVMWEDQTRHNANTSGITVISKTTSVIIPLEADTGDKVYIPPLEYAKLPIDNNNHWTLSADQSNPDVIVFGEIDKEVTDSYTIQDLLKEFKSTSIQSVEDYSTAPFQKHFEVGGL